MIVVVFFSPNFQSLAFSLPKGLLSFSFLVTLVSLGRSSHLSPSRMLFQDLGLFVLLLGSVVAEVQCLEEDLIMIANS